MPPVKAAALSNAPPAMIATLAMLSNNNLQQLYISEHIFNSLISNVGGEDFVVLEVLFKRDASFHDGGEFCVVHCTTEVKFSFKTFFAT